MKINITTTIEIDKNEEDPITQEDINEAYKKFKEIITRANKTGDIAQFLFINPDTNQEIENEVEE